MPPHTSQEMRERMVHWHEQLGKSTSEISELAGCSERTVCNVLRLHGKYGTVQNPLSRPRGGPRVLNTGDMNYLSSVLTANPSPYLDKLQDCLSQSRGVDVSIATIC
ncbi:hypothetical protein PAXRUDRAFT_170956 [Paxillus rubicundulus Ve08.2h10]|uniref:Paired domain-containing protein n=1 Tax=Paxillus rubicundulus Ve08.2h10 TaxID=930991 RepID=A0A0D0D785_9AGAM|nr:hypothetical protein PAXRUDRAFT_170956 [Paxillus rubicundulus Ve08.2h10]